ncbi:hypothetical protein NADFUDRAFT_22552 [Nadsonia fulvescens var. elongata DSM 6958]|uniref:Photolyase/cryptochrome alpha/beta domain-containing protein n=1 Tax=Nadsonia fulvescens var. elongata DSM 6958 TaxID=857566 RepID=A0A1E3PL60_9ASCO|nr:hypothetical protein NADFUDRAFT_22552 [Nadsonia fulvescens var. elongata DSM 6958]
MKTPGYSIEGDDNKRVKFSANDIGKKYVDEFYPHTITNERAIKYTSGDLEKPLAGLERALKEADTALSKNEIEKTNSSKKCIVHWFKTDLRASDNSALSAASQAAKDSSLPLITVYLFSAKDLKAHRVSKARIDFILRSLSSLRQTLAELHIPLCVEWVDEKLPVSTRLLDLCKEWQATEIWANMEYEVDELRRDTKLIRSFAEKRIKFNVLHDTCVVQPGSVATKEGKQYSVFTPWFRAWSEFVSGHHKSLQSRPSLHANTDNEVLKYWDDLFEQKMPDIPSHHKLEVTDADRLSGLWPAGEAAANHTLETFIKNKLRQYKNTRDFPFVNGTSHISVHLAAGTLSARSAVRAALEVTPTLTDAWIREVAWRDFYRHVLAHWPYVCMNKPFKLRIADIEWEYNDEHFRAWTQGRTGYPIVDAAMRELLSTGYMPNRCRMIVASFLAKHLMLDWKMGENWFMEHLIDGDFSSNNGGWGFCASAGVDAQPYFRILNPLLQSEKFDPDGIYIRKWVPELANCTSKQVHAPHSRGFSNTHEYPEPIVDHKVARERALARYKLAS